MEQPGYYTFDVVFEHTGSEENGTRRIDRRVITVFGNSNTAIEQELKRQERALRGIAVLSYERR